MPCGREQTTKRGDTQLCSSRTHRKQKIAIARGFIASMMLATFAAWTISFATAATVSSPAFIAGIIPIKSGSSSDALFVD